MDHINRVGKAFGFMKTINSVQRIACSYYKKGDWRRKNAILMCFSKLSENLDLKKLGYVIRLAKMGAKDQHPRVRFAAAQLLGQLSNDLKPNFQVKYLK